MSDQTAEASPTASGPRRAIYELIPLTVGADAFATQIRALGEDLREADRCIADAAHLDVLGLRALWVLRTEGPQLTLDLPDRLQARPDTTAAVLAKLAAKGLVEAEDRRVAVTEAGSLLVGFLYGPLDARLADCMMPHALTTLKAMQDLVTAWQDAIRGHDGFLASLPAIAVSEAVLSE
jgi:hypothetical protein